MSDIFSCHKHRFGSRIHLYCPFCTERALRSELRKAKRELAKCIAFFDLSGCDAQLYDSVKQAAKEIK